MINGALPFVCPPGRTGSLSAIVARRAPIDQRQERVSGRQWHRDSHKKAAGCLPVRWWSAHADRVVSWSNVESTGNGRCRTTQQPPESGPNTMCLQVHCRSAETDSQHDRTRSIATNGRPTSHPHFALRRSDRSRSRFSKMPRPAPAPNSAIEKESVETLTSGDPLTSDRACKPV
jgi:hypothetical protein